MNLRRLAENSFIGYNDRVSPEYLKRGYLADALNCFLRSGEIVKRKGYSLIGNDVGDAPCQGLRGVRFASGTREILAIFNGIVYKWTGSGNLSAISGTYTLSTSGLVDIVVANNAVYFFDGTNTVPKYDGSTMSTVAAIPVGKYARWFHNQLHVAGISGDPNALRSSDIGDPETFTGGNSSDLDVNPNDGDYITGLHELNDELIISKVNRLWSGTGFGTAALTLDDINERLTGFGSLSHFGFVNTGNDLIYPSFLGDKPVLRSLIRTRYGTIVDDGIISDDIEGTMGGLNKTKFDQTTGIFDGRYAWFAVASGSSTYTNLVLTYDTITKGWTRHTGINASCFISFAISNQPQLYFGESSDDSKVYLFDNSTSDNGESINFSITSRRYGGESTSMKKKYKWLYLTGDDSGDYDVDVDYSVDGFSFDNLGTWNLSGSGAIFDMIILDQSRLGQTDINRKRISIPKSRHYTFQFKLSDDSDESSISIRSWELYYIMKKRPIDTL